MVNLLKLRKENATQDYKRELPTRGFKTCAFLDLLKDLVAMANMGGGVVVFGVEDESYEPVGLCQERKSKRLDEQDISRAFHTYLDTDTPFELTYFEYKGKQFAFLKVAGVQRPLLFRKDAQCEHCGDKATVKHFYIGSTFIRSGSSTVRASEAWLTEKLCDLQLTDTLRNASRTIPNNLPGRDSIYDTFVGRKEPLRRAIQLLKDQRRRVTWIRGSGGIGKTALAYRIAESIVGAEELVKEFHYVVWISAKETALTLAGIEARTPTLTRLADVVAAVVETTGMVELPDGDIVNLSTTEQAIGAIRPVLDDLTGLLVLDNLETVKDQEVALFLQNLPGRTRALATTRRSMDQIGGDTVLLEPMGISEADDLIKTEAIRTGRTWLTNDDQAVMKVMHLSGGIPLAIRLIVPRLDSPKSLRNYQDAAPLYEKDLLEFCYQQTYSDLEEVERRILYATSLFADGDSLRDLGFMLRVDLNDPRNHDTLLHQIERLWHLSLVVIRQSGATIRYEMQSLVRRFVTRRLYSDAALKAEFRQQLALLEVNKADDILGNARKALQEYKETGQYEDAMAVLDECLKRDPKSIQAWISKAEIELLHGRYPQRAANAASEAKSLAEPGTASWIKATVYLAELEVHSGKYTSAIELLSEIDEGRADHAVFLLLSECYLRIADGLKQ